MARRDLCKRDIFSHAFFAGMIAPSGKPASGLGIDGIPHLATNNGGPSVTLGKIRHGDGGKERLCIRVQRMEEQFVGTGLLHALA